MDNIQHPNNYDNKAAHDALKKMMMRADILDLFFNIDKYGFCSVRVKSSKQPKSIEYQIGYDGYVWIMAYLMQPWQMNCLILTFKKKKILPLPNTGNQPIT